MPYSEAAEWIIMTRQINHDSNDHSENHPVIITNILKKQGSSTVLGPVPLVLKKGEILGIRGKNGAGKSTLIKIITGIIKADSGTVTMSAETKDSIGYVPQDIALYPTLSGKNNLAFWAGLYGIHGKRKNVRIDWLLDKVQLTDKANVSLEDYSGGMKRRLNLAAALLITPKLFLLDEPTVGADIQSVEIILSMMTHIKDRGASVIFVSHRDDELEQICDRIITLDEGLIVDERIVIST
jgi:ABC-2 type transport system ATP-binding protein